MRKSMTTVRPVTLADFMDPHGVARREALDKLQFPERERALRLRTARAALKRLWTHTSKLPKDSIDRIANAPYPED